MPDELWKIRAAELRDRLVQEPTPEKRFWLMEQFLMQKVRSPDYHPAVGFSQFFTIHLRMT
jgi:hypothetical protein